MMRIIGLWAIFTACFLVGCSTTGLSGNNYDYSEFRQSQPRSILVLPPLNNSVDVNAGYGVISQVTYPLAESGYYVFPVAVVNETFKQNGLTNAADIHAITLSKLNEIFGADAILYITITEYGTQYKVIDSETKVRLKARLVDAKTGKELWSGAASASTAEGQSTSNQSIVGILVSAAVNQVVNTLSDKSYDVAGIADQRLLSAGGSRSLLYGPRSPHYTSQHLAK